MVDSVRQVLEALNHGLAEAGDSARVRFAAIEPDPDFDGEWLAVVTWELPNPPDDDESWPLEVLDRYCVMSADALAGSGVGSHCQFRTRAQIAEDPSRGVAIQEAV
ncbi:MAG: hypothetical protein WD826_04030 [Actinomycetota bacterium]